MKTIQRIIITVTILSSIFRSSPGTAAVIDTPRFIVHYEGENGLYADLVADYAEKGHEKVASLIGWDINHKIDIYIAPTNERFRELTGGGLPDWSAAVTLGPDTVILSPLEGQKQELGHVITHELAHIVINDLTGDMTAPRWFHEGVAEMVSGSLGIQGRVYLIIRTAQNKLLSFDDIQNIFASGQTDATLAYDQSMLAVRQLVELYGQGIIRKILERMRDYESFDQAFAEITGISVERFEAAYLIKLRAQYKYTSLIPSFINMWTIILGIAILVFIIQRFRTRRIIRRWEAEEKHPDIIHFPDDPDFDD